MKLNHVSTFSGEGQIEVMYFRHNRWFVDYRKQVTISLENVCIFKSQLSLMMGFPHQDLTFDIQIFSF